jgi:hypothetical protein
MYLTPKNQAEIVETYLTNNTEFGQEVTDFATFPNIQHLFQMPPSNQVVTSENIKIPNHRRLLTGSKEQIAMFIVNTLKSRKGVVGFNWTLEKDIFEIKVCKTVLQNLPQNEEEDKDLIEYFQMILKSRKNIKALNWSFGEDHIKITYQV